MNESILPYRISFIVIAKNESFTISRCIYSIISCGETLLNYEIIFIDSLSSDGTLEKVKKVNNKKIRIFQITKNANAAVARNVGIRYLKYEYIFFVDGDVEIHIDFIKSAIKEMKNSHQIGAIYGQIKEFQYISNYKKVIRIVKDRMGIKKRISQIVRGGIFFTKNSVVKDIGNFDERLKQGEDRDYIMRVISKYKVLGLPIQMGVHHTIAYRDTKRIIKCLFDFSCMYHGVLLRKHIFYMNRMLIVIRRDYGIILGGLFLPLLFLTIFTPYIFIKIIFGLFLVVDLFLGLKKEPENLLGRFISHYIFSFYFLLGFLFYFPKHKKVEWKEIC